MKYRIRRLLDNAIEADVDAFQAFSVPVSYTDTNPEGNEFARVSKFHASRGWIVNAAVDAIPGYTIETYEPDPEPPLPAPTQWTVPLTVLLERLSDADAELIFTWVEARPAKQRARLRAGVAVDTVTPSATETAIRTELTNRGYNPNVVLAQP